MNGNKSLRFIIDLIVTMYTIFAIYYLIKLIIDLYHALFPPFDLSFVTGHFFKFILIYGLVIGGHILISIWMYWDFSKRKFSNNNLRLFWLAMLSAGFAPIYYYIYGRKPTFQ